jgi:hypothetical protein
VVIDVVEAGVASYGSANLVTTQRAHSEQFYAGSLVFVVSSVLSVIPQ